MKGASGYFLFTEEQRATARDELLRELGEGATKVSVAQVAKALGQKWKQLSDAEREVYKAKAQEQAAAAAAAAKEDGSHAEGEAGEAAGGSPSGAHARESTPLDGLLPVSVVRKVMLLDEDVTRVSQDGVIAAAMAVDLLLGLLAKGAGASARAQKRKTVNLKDFVQAVKQDRRMAQAGLKDIEAAVLASSEAEAAVRNQAKEAREAAKAAAGEGEEDAGVEVAGEGGEEGEVEEGNENKAPGNADGGKAKRGRPSIGGGNKKAKSDKDKAAQGSKKIDSFFSRAS